MFNEMTFNQFIEVAQKEKRIVVYKEISIDYLTPVTAFEALGKDAKNASILESGFFDQQSGRYSQIFIHPYDKFVIHKAEKKTPSLNILQQNLNKNSSYAVFEQLHFLNCAIGFLSYDAIRLFEKIPDRHTNDEIFPAVFFRFYQSGIFFDHQTNKVFICTVAVININDYHKVYNQAMTRINDLLQKITKKANVSRKQHSKKIPQNTSKLDLNLSDEQFKQLVDKAKKYIVKGDVYQVVLSRRFYKKYSVSPFQIYRALRITNPSPYMFYIEYNGTFIVGSSPEKLVSVKNNLVETIPIAGTRPRGTNPEQDKFLTKELLADEKENAEHVMLVDLGRNDIGAVCQPGTVKVKTFKNIQYLSKVMHIVSIVEGTLSKTKNALDALRAVFPAGTLSGAPKIRAMEIIDELEPCRRGLYGGAICRIDNKGNLDSCIAIRMAILKNGLATVQAGGGIVFDSDPQEEANETYGKASAVLAAIDLAKGGLQ